MNTNSTESGSIRPTGGVTAALERRVGPLPQFATSMLIAGGIISAVCIGASALVLVGLQLVAGSADALHYVAGQIAFAVILVNMAPFHISASGSAGYVDISARLPVTAVTLVALAIIATGAFRVGRSDRLGWPSGVAIALVYATVTSIVGSIFASYIGSSGATLSLSYPATWFLAFGWALVAAVPGSMAGAGHLSYLVGGRRMSQLWAQWRGPILGSATAVAICLLAGVLVAFGVLMYALSTQDTGGHGWAYFSVFLAGLPTLAIYVTHIGLLARFDVSATAGSTYSVSQGLLSGWQGTAWAYLLPLIPLAACVIGGLVALHLSGRRAAAFQMAVPFGIANLLLAFVSGLDASVDTSGSLSGLLSLLNLSSGSAHFGPSALEALFFSVLFGLGGGGIAWYMWANGSRLPQGYAPEDVATRFGLNLAPVVAATNQAPPFNGPTYKPPPARVDTAQGSVAVSPPPATERRDRPRQANDVGIPLSEVLSSSPAKQQSGRVVCSQCGNISVAGTAECPACGAPFGSH
jgi:hypothetical protein